MAEALAERVHPKTIGELWVAHGDVSGNAFAESESSEDAQRASKLLLALGTLFFNRGEGGRQQVESNLSRGELYAVD